jgi:signal transduction histidine kinase
MNLKTSTKISLKFTIFTISLLLFFGLFANITFFYNRYNTSIYKVFQPIKQRKNPLLKPISSIETYPSWSEEAKLVRKNILFKKISKIWDRYFVSYKVNNWLKIMDVTERVDWQFNLFLITIYLTIFFSILSYLLSLFFVKNSLKTLNKLVNFTEKLNIDNLDQNLRIDWPDDDEIKIVANSLNNFILKLNNQTLALKDFISNTSHELKTPLMVISTDIDYALKSKKYENWLQNIKENIKNINDLINNLSLITKIESWYNLKIEELNVSEIFYEKINIFKNQFIEKSINLELDILENIYIKTNKASFEIVIKNLIENAFKYSKKNWNIKFHLDVNNIYIEDNWIWIDKKNLDKIWDRFWKEDKSRTEEKSFGLWLYMVKKIIEIYDWKITVKSEKNIWTKFIISFN